MWCEAYPGAAIADENPSMLASGQILNVKILLLKMEVGTRRKKELSSFPLSAWRVGGLGRVAATRGGLCCRDCFKAFYVHKFRAVLGKNRLIFPGEKVKCGVILCGAAQMHSPWLSLFLLPSCRQPVPATSHQPLLLSRTWALRMDPCLGISIAVWGGGQAHIGDVVPSSDIASLPGASGMVWGAFIQLHGLAGP